MSDFKPISTQEEFDEAIKQRIARERAKFADYDDLKAKLAGFDDQMAKTKAAAESYTARIAELEKTLSEKDATIAERDKTIAGNALEQIKIRTALSKGLPYEMAARLTGTTEEEISADADSLAGMFAGKGPAPMPAKNPETPPEEDGVTAAFLAKNPNLRIKND